MPDAMTRTVCAVVLFAGLFAPVARAEETSITFALVPKQVNNSFFDLADEGCKLAASKLPDVSCLYVGPADEGDAQAQADIIDDLIAGVYGPISGMSVPDRIHRAVQGSNQRARGGRAGAASARRRSR